jgi:site-specific recombinase XerD
MLHLLDCHYASNTIDNYQAGLTRLAHWTTQCNIDVKNIDEKTDPELSCLSNHAWYFSTISQSCWRRFKLTRVFSGAAY